jgi:hypothetical protein
MSARDILARAVAAPEAFSHRDHVRLAYELHRRYGFAGGMPRLARGLKAVAAAAGRSERYHETLTTAFYSLVGERLGRSANPVFDAFLEENPDLMDRGLIGRRYTAERLAEPLARATFLLPSPR